MLVYRSCRSFVSLFKANLSELIKFYSLRNQRKLYSGFLMISGGMKVNSFAQILNVKFVHDPLVIYIFFTLASVTYRWMDRYRDHYMPMHRTGSNSSIGQSSSNSSGLVPDCDPRHDLADRLYKLSVNTDINFRWKQCRQIGGGAFGTVRSILTIFRVF